MLVPGIPKCHGLNSYVMLRHRLIHLLPLPPPKLMKSGVLRMLRVIYASMIPNESNATATIATYVMLLSWRGQEQNPRTKLGRRRRSSRLGGAVSSLGGPASARAPSAAAFGASAAVPALALTLAAVPAAPAGSSAVPATAAAASSASATATATTAAVVARMVVQRDGPEGFRVEGALLGPPEAAVDPLMAVHRKSRPWRSRKGKGPKTGGPPRRRRSRPRCRCCCPGCWFRQTARPTFQSQSPRPARTTPRCWRRSSRCRTGPGASKGSRRCRVEDRGRGPDPEKVRCPVPLHQRRHEMNGPTGRRQCRGHLLEVQSTPMSEQQ
jgi:hypothetical protein